MHRLLLLILLLAWAASAQASSSIPLVLAPSGGGQVVVSWPAPTGQALATVVVRHAGVDRLADVVATAGQATVRAAAGDTVIVTAWDIHGGLRGVGRAQVPHTVFLPILRR